MSVTRTRRVIQRFSITLLFKIAWSGILWSKGCDFSCLRVWASSVWVTYSRFLLSLSLSLSLNRIKTVQLTSVRVIASVQLKFRRRGVFNLSLKLISLSAKITYHAILTTKVAITFVQIICCVSWLLCSLNESYKGDSKLRSVRISGPQKIQSPVFLHWKSCCWALFNLQYMLRSWISFFYSLRLVCFRKDGIFRRGTVNWKRSFPIADKEIESRFSNHRSPWVSACHLVLMQPEWPIEKNYKNNNILIEK